MFHQSYLSMLFLFEITLNDEVFHKVMMRLNEKSKKKKDILSCCLLSQLYVLKLNSDPKYKEEFEKESLNT